MEKGRKTHEPGNILPTGCLLDHIVTNFVRYCNCRRIIHHSYHMDHKISTITVNGVRLSYSDTGAGNKTLVLVHAFPLNKNMWKEQVEKMKDRFRVITYDIRGFGDSEPGSETASIDLFASDLLALIDKLDISKPVVCGLSMGGYILLNAVSRAPGKFGGVIFADTQCIADSDEARDKRYKTIEKIRDGEFDDFAEEFSSSMVEDPHIQKKVKEMVKSNSAEVVSAALRAMATRRESCTALKQLSLPALVIYGSKDNVTPASQSELLFNAIAGSKLSVIENAGHLSNLEKTIEFNKEIEAFMERL